MVGVICLPNWNQPENVLMIGPFLLNCMSAARYICIKGMLDSLNGQKKLNSPRVPIHSSGPVPYQTGTMLTSTLTNNQGESPPSHFCKYV